MKKHLNLIVAAILLGVLTAISCNNEANPEPQTYDEKQQAMREASKYQQELTDKWQSVTKDGCEYWVYDYFANSSSHVYAMTHKGNCSNPIHYGK